MDFASLSSFLDSLIPFGITGVDCAVSVKGRTVFRHGAGYADREAEIPICGDELYHVYSATKLVTCVAALRLFERGAFLMSDPLCDYLPEFRHMSVLDNGALRPARKKIRIGNLFTMTAGLSYDIESPSVRTLRDSSPHCTTRELASALARESLLFEPGERWNYSLCHDVLGALVEVVSGVSLGEYMRRELFEPLGMRDTAFVIPKEKQPRLAAQYVYDGDTRSANRIGKENVFCFGSIESGGAGLISSVEDFILFSEALACNGTGRGGMRVLSPRTVELMRSNQLNAAQTEGLKQMIGRGMGYGLGAAVVCDRAAAGTVAPNGQFGWGGAAGAQVIIDCESQTALYYAQHMLNNLERYVQPRLRNILFSCL